MSRARDLVARHALGISYLLLLLLFFAAPLATVVVLAFRPFDPVTLTGQGFTLANIWRFLGDTTYQADFWRTIWISGVTTLAALVLSYPVAWHLSRLRSTQARLWLTLVVLTPLMTSLVVSSFAWLLILGNSGIINSALIALGITSDSVPLMNSSFGVIVVSTYSYLPFAILPIYASLETIDPNVGKAARIYSGGSLRTFFRVTLPLVLPGVVSGGLIVFSLSMAAFVIPFVIGGGKVVVVPLLIYRFTMQLFDWPGAAALGVLLFVVTIAISLGISRLAQHLMPWDRPR